MKSLQADQSPDIRVCWREQEPQRTGHGWEHEYRRDDRAAVRWHVFVCDRTESDPDDDQSALRYAQ